MSVEEQQKIIDRVMQRMALRHGSSKPRDFEVACLMLDELIGSGKDATKAQAASTRRSEAP